jgi:hypothetical protein
MLKKTVLVAALLLVLVAGVACSGSEPGATQVISRPLAPAPVNGGFRQDSANAVAATGKPQLIEFYAPT